MCEGPARVTILGLEMSAASVGFAVMRGEELVIEHTLARPPAASEALLVSIERALGEAHVARNALDAVAVTQGPGSFTGVRVGLAAAQGLAIGLQRPLVALSTLDALLAPLLPRDGLAIAAIDARRGEVYVAAASAPVSGDGAVEYALDPLAATPEDAAAQVADILDPSEEEDAPASLADVLHHFSVGYSAGTDTRAPLVIAGSGARSLVEHLVRCTSVPVVAAPAPLWTPRASTVAWLGGLRLAAGGAIAPEEATALYLREAHVVRKPSRSKAPT
jgi:tRNA threonylcarbamoyladenosine biosynthesis protein TsaB